MKDQHDFGGDYARDGGWSGGGSADDYTREPGRSADFRDWSGGGRADDYGRQGHRGDAVTSDDERAVDSVERPQADGKRHIGKASE
jgi:hypothetical protein